MATTVDLKNFGSIPQASRLARLSFDMTDVRGLVQTDLAELFGENAVGFVSATVAARVGKRMSDLIGVQHRNKIGFTGKASKNIMISAQPGSSSSAKIELFEGDLTHANTFIRLGRRSAKFPNIEALSDWVRRKPGMKNNITYQPWAETQKGLRDPDYKLPEDKKVRFTKYGGEKANLRSQPGRAFKRDQALFEQVLFLMSRAIAYGRGGGKFLDYRPAGSPWFDYAREALFYSGNYVWGPDFERAADLGMQILIDYARHHGASKSNVPKWVTGGAVIDAYRFSTGAL